MSLENDPFLKIADTILNPHIKRWKQQGKKIVGYYCTYIPEELIHAAGLLPFRIRSTGNEDTDLGDIYMVRFTCSFIRMTLDLALKGGFDFLDGLVMSNCCDHARRMFEVFNMKVFERDVFKEKPASFYVPIPHVITNEGLDYYCKQVKRLKKEIEQKFEINQINDDLLVKSIEIYNQNRKLLRNINELRKQQIPKLNGNQALKLAMANASVPKEVANKELERIFQMLKEFEGIKTENKRIMLLGSIMDNTGFIDIIENAGGLVVSDFLCFGTRTQADDVDLESNNDPLQAIVKRVYERISCPRMMDDHQRRLEFVNNEIKSGNIDGVILQRINNCDLHGCENMILEHELKEDLDVPVFNIDRENFQKDYTRLKTRLEAFLEML